MMIVVITLQLDSYDDQMRGFLYCEHTWLSALETILVDNDDDDDSDNDNDDDEDNDDDDDDGEMAKSVCLKQHRPRHFPSRPQPWSQTVKQF